MAATDIQNLCSGLNMMMVYQFGHHAGRDRQMRLSQRFRIDIPDALIQEGIEAVIVAHGQFPSVCQAAKS